MSDVAEADIEQWVYRDPNTTDALPSRSRRNGLARWG
jgi:hypothetical protein